MIKLNFNTDKPEQWLSPLDFPLTLVNEQGIIYKIIRTAEGTYACIKPKKQTETT